MSLFVVIDGVDGAGKGTQVALLRDALVGLGHRVHVTCEPSELPVGALIREWLRKERRAHVPSWAAMGLLFAADRLIHVEHEIAPALARGEIVICDRYDASSIAYQSAMNGGSDEALVWIAELNREARRPDLTILLDLAPEVARDRRAARGGEEELFEKLDLQRKVREQYAKLGRVRPNDRIVTVDAGRAVDAIHAELLAHVLHCARGVR